MRDGREEPVLHPVHLAQLFVRLLELCGARPDLALELLAVARQALGHDGVVEAHGRVGDQKAEEPQIVTRERISSIDEHERRGPRCREQGDRQSAADMPGLGVRRAAGERKSVEQLRFPLSQDLLRGGRGPGALA